MTGLLRVSPTEWVEPATLPAMSNLVDRHDRYRLTSQCLLVDGRPTIPVTGELHFSRVPRDRWDERLRLMRAAGVAQVSTYIFWNHHEEQRGRIQFDGNRDLAAFIRLADQLGLGVILRVGPWSHGEARYGGFPDWVQHSGAELRTDDPRYLELVERWFTVLGEVAGDFCGPYGPVVSIQIENELVDRPHHIHTLKHLLRRAGLVAPLWTSSAWGSAQLPGEEVLPLFGGYPDGFWMDHDAPWDDSFRSHFFFSHDWDDTQLGADVRQQQGTQATGRPAASPMTVFPVVTCELGGGMVGSYHRRPWPSALDVAAIAGNALGSGSAWQGYYMFAGGTNPPGADGLQESHATGYPNDLPRFDYDFHAPIGASGRISPSLAPLRRQHAFLAAFGESLAGMHSTLPETLPQGLRDRTTLRWALRGDGSAGFLFIGWHQPEEPLADYRGAQFEVALHNQKFQLPAEPVDIPAGTVTRWPINLDVDGVRLRWATAAPLTVLDGPRKTLVLTADHGIPVELALPDGLVDEKQGLVLPGAEGFFIEAGSRLDVVVLAADRADDVWVVDRQLVLCEEPLWTDDNGRLVARAVDRPDVLRYEPARREFLSVPVECRGLPPRREELAARLDREPHLAPRSYGERGGRASAPRDADFLAHAAQWSLTLPDWLGQHGDLLELEVNWAGDAAQLWVDDRPVADRFWDGSAWIVDLSTAGIASGSRLTLRILPLFGNAPIHLPAAARDRRDAGPLPLWSLASVRLVASSVWRECDR